MTKPIACLALILVYASSYSQTPDKVVSEENVSRILKALSADGMMGRPAGIPERMEPAIAFIENEFKTIGLKPLNGLSGFRQEFEKEKVSLDYAQVSVDGATIATENALVISDRKIIEITNGTAIWTLPYDTAVKDGTQQFYVKVSQFLKDTASALLLVAPEYREGFTALKHYYGERFTSGRKNTKIVVIGVAGAATYSVNAAQRTKRIRMTNVVGMLEGRRSPQEMVVFSGHYDHIGVLPVVNEDSIANGADDDASGTTAVIELARYFKKAKMNERTLIFVAFTAEEIGGFGSKYFSEHIDAGKVVAMFNIEMIGKPSKWGRNSAFVTGFERSDFGAILERNLTGTGFSFKADPYPEQDLFYRSDNATLARLGVPAHTISTDQIDIDKLYHTVDDEFESIDIANLAGTIRAIARSATSIVKGTDTPTRIDKTTVR